MEQEIIKFLIQVLAFAASSASKPTTKDWFELLKTLITAAGPIIAALIVGIAGAYVTYKYNKDRDTQQQTAENTRHSNQIIAENTRHFNQLIAADKEHRQDVALIEKRHDLDKETEWRTHAIELTKLDMQRKLVAWKPGLKPLRPSILDFLANYRNLKELDNVTPRELYLIIERQRMTYPEAPVVIESPPIESPPDPYQENSFTDDLTVDELIESPPRSGQV